MDERHITIHIKNFNDRVRAMSQTNSKDLTMSANDARNLQADIFNLLTLVTEFASKLNTEEDIQIQLDGGSFK